MNKIFLIDGVVRSPINCIAGFGQAAQHTGDI